MKYKNKRKTILNCVNICRNTNPVKIHLRHCSKNAGTVKPNLTSKMLQTSIVPKLASDLLKEAEEYYLQHQKFSNDILTQLYSVFGNTLTLATELLDNCRITQYQTPDKCRKIYKIGSNLERYTIYNEINYCHCKTFREEVLEGRASVTCRHVLAVKLNQITGNVKVQVETVTDSQFVEFLNEQLVDVNE